jgi:hypothetical protein
MASIAVFNVRIKVVQNITITNDFLALFFLGVCVAHYRFLYVDVGTPGRWSDGGTFDQCSLNEAVEAGQLQIPGSSNPPGCEIISPYFFVGDEAFPLRPWLMRPIPGRSLENDQQRIYNYRLSRARRTIENAFGILVSRWRILNRSLNMKVEHAENVILACCILHTFLHTKSTALYPPPNFIDSLGPDGNIVDGEWHNEPAGSNPTAIRRTNNLNPTLTAVEVRGKLVNYFNTDGSVP